MNKKNSYQVSEHTANFIECLKSASAYYSQVMDAICITENITDNKNIL